MGQTYSVSLRLKFKDEQGAKNALQDKISKGQEGRIDYGLGRAGIDLDSLDCLLRIFFAGWDLQWDDTPVQGLLSSGFDASYGWESVMMDAFDAIAPYLEELSNITIYPDSGKDFGVIVNGEPCWKV